MSNAVAFSSAVLPAMGIARDLLTRTFSASLILVTTLASGILAQSEQTAPAPQPSTERPAATLDFQGSLAAARDLYASADYLAALDMLDRLVAAQPSPEDHQSIDLYRTFCFVALGRTREADETITAMISRDPLYHPADSEIPPRLRPMFSDKRKLVLPSIIQANYVRAKSTEPTPHRVSLVPRLRRQQSNPIQTGGDAEREQ